PRPRTRCVLERSRQRDAASVRGGDHRRALHRRRGDALRVAHRVRVHRPQGADRGDGGRARVIVWMLFMSAATAPLPESVTLDQVLQLLSEESPRTIAERSEVRIAAADRIDAELWPNPDISYGGTQLARGPNTGTARAHQITMQQPLLLFGQR